MKSLVFLSVLLLSFGCTSIQNHSQKVWVLVPYENFPLSYLKNAATQLAEINPHIKVIAHQHLPKQAFYKQRSRFRADTLIRVLRDQFGKDTLAIGLTTKDISITKNGVNDWGIYGLGFRPGKACVISIFRLEKNKQDQLQKVILHEIGHTLGLNHCKVKNCYMRDAEGGNPLNELTQFCASCSRKLNLPTN